MWLSDLIWLIFIPNGVELVPSCTVMDASAQLAAVDFLLIVYGGNQPFCLYLLLSEHSELLSTRYDFRLYFLILSIRVFWLVLRWILIIVAVDSTFLDALWFTGDKFFSLLRPFGKSLVRDWRLALRKPLGPSSLAYSGPLSPFMLHFVYCYNNCLLLT